MPTKQISKTPQTSKRPSRAPTKIKAPSPDALTKDWKEVQKNILLLSGYYNQAHKKFKGHNQQSAAVCIVACAFSALKNTNSWTRDVLDMILDVGTNLYLKSRQFPDKKCLDHLNPFDVYKYFFLGDLKLSMRVSVDIWTERIPRDATILQKIEDFLERFFSQKNSGIFACQKVYFAIWKQNKYFYVFDPLEHDLDGSKWPGLATYGYCYCMRTHNIKDLADIIMKNCPLKPINKFTIYPCWLEKFIRVNTVPPETYEQAKPEVLEPTKVVDTTIVVTKPKIIKKPPPEKSLPVEKPPEEAGGQEIEPKKSISKSMIPIERPKLDSVTNFIEFGDKMGVLRASTHQRDPRFTRYMGAQSVANAIAALTMLRQYRSKLWIRNIVDDILRLGEIIHHDSKKLKPGEYVKKITLNERDYSPKIQRCGAVGRLESSDEKILNLKQALQNTLLEKDCCILLGPQIVAIWKQEGRYYMFDPEERDSYGRKLEPGLTGVACVVWFSKLDDLVTHYLNNLHNSERNARFMLSQVAIKDYQPLAEDWYNFKALTSNKWILRGNFSQQDRRFPPESRNAQCTANATMALAYKELKEEKDWDPETIDEVLINGDEFYRGCIDYLQETGRFKHKYLMVDELKRNFDVGNKRVALEIDDCLVNGIVNAKSDTGILNLRKGFEEFFHESDAGIITANLQSMAVWRRDDTYYYYDSHSRNEKGVVCGFGTACILRTVTIDDLTNALTINLGPDPQNLYNISRVVVKLMDLTDDGFVKPPLNFYEALNDLIAILRSNTSQKDTKYGISAGKQTVPMCLAALAFNSVTPAFEWNKDDVDQVLDFGNDLYNESMEANYSEEIPEEVNVDDISTVNVKKQMKIGPNSIEFEFEDLASGNLEQLPEALESLSGRIEQESNDIFQSILESEYMIVSMWRDDNLYYLFDPRARDEKGQIYGKDDWSVKIIEEVEEEEIEEEDEDEEEFEGEELEMKKEDEWKTDENKDEMGGGDNLGEPEPTNESEQRIEDLEGEEEMEEEEIEELPPPIEKKGSAFWRMKEQEGGKSCVLRFSRIEDLINHIMENSPPNRREDIEFSLKLAKINNEPKLHEVFDPETEEKTDEFVGDWNEFSEIDYGKWILRGGKNFMDALYPACNRGKQAIPMCMVALTFANLYALCKYKKTVVDDILLYGDRLYTVMRKLRTKDLKNNKELGLSEEEIEQILDHTEFKITDYPKKMCMGEKLATYEMTLEVIQGDTTSKDPETVHNVTSGLTKFFEENKFGILICRDYPVGVWKDEDIFYMFDPHPSGPNGVKSPIGVSCITRFKEIDDLAQVYIGNLPKIGTNMFEIHSFTFTKEPCIRPRHPEEKEEPVPKIGGFSAVTAGKNILRGDMKLDCTKFDRGVHIHSSAIAFVALALSLNKDPDTWTRLIVNEILNVGEELYNESVEKLGDKFNPWADRLDICRVNPDFQIGSLKVSCTIRYTEQKGIVDIKNSKTPNLRQGLERFFDENTHGVLIADKFVLPVWEHSRGEEVNIYMFDPNSRGGTGLPSQGGVACVMKFCNAKVASDHIMACMMDIDKTKTTFSIVPIEIVVGSVKTKRKVCKLEETKKKAEDLSCKCKPPTIKPVTCPTKTEIMEKRRVIRKIAEEVRSKKEAKRCSRLGRDAIYELNNNQAIIRGIRAIAKDRELPVNLVAFVFMRIATDLSKWTYKQIELILEAGYQLYVDSFNAYKPESSKLTLQHVLRRVMLKDLEVKIEIKKPILGNAFTTQNLLTHLMNFFNITNFCILNYDDFLVSVYLKGGYYYLFDPYSRDLNGNRTENGSAMLMRFGELPELVDRIVRNLKRSDDETGRYCLVVVNIQSVQPITK